MLYALRECIVLCASQYMSVKLLNEIIPNITYLVCLLLGFVLSAFDKFIPYALLNEYSICIRGDDKVVFSDCIDIPQIVRQEFLFTCGKNFRVTGHKPLFLRQILNKVGYSVQCSHDDLQKGVVKNMNKTFGRVNLADCK